MFELNGSYSYVQKTKNKNGKQVPFLAARNSYFGEKIEERCLVVFLETRVVGDWWDSPQSVHSNKIKLEGIDRRGGAQGKE